MSKLLAIFKKKKVWIPLAVIVIAVLIKIFSGGSVSGPATVLVDRGSVVLEVSVTGRVKPTKNLDLAFERSGRLQSIPVQVGDGITSGQTLATLDHSDLEAQLAQAQAQYQSQQAKLDQLQKNAQDTNLQDPQAKATIDLQTAYTNALDSVRDAYSKSDDAVRVQTDGLIDTTSSISPQVTFETSATEAKINAGSLRTTSQSTLDAWLKDLSAVNANNHATMDTVLQSSVSRMNTFFDLYNNLQEALNNAKGLDSTTQASYKAKLTIGKAELVAALTALNKAQQNIASQKTTNKNSVDDIAIQQGQVDQAYAQILYYQSQIAKAILKAPFNGTVTRLPYNIGDIVQSNTPVVSLIGSGKYQIETNVAESDIAKIKVGDTAKVTLDAYGQDVVFKAHVIAIDLSETMIEGVPTYKTTLEFDDSDSRILPGLTANIDILSDQKDNVLFIPTRVITVNDSKKTVLVPTVDARGKATSTPIEIETGLKGSDGRTEIIKGLQEGDKVVTE